MGRKVLIRYNGVIVGFADVDDEGMATFEIFDNGPHRFQWFQGKQIQQMSIEPSHVEQGDEMTDEAGFSVGSRTTRPHSKTGWNPERPADTEERKALPKRGSVEFGESDATKKDKD